MARTPAPARKTRTTRRAASSARRAQALDLVKQLGVYPGAVPASERLVEGPGAYSVPADLRLRLRERLLERMAYARKHWGKAFRMPTLRYDLTGTTAGTANYATWTIALNGVLLVENPDHMVQDTLVHELAHLLTGALFGGEATSHGPHWKGVMRTLGVEPSRTHRLDTSNAAVGAILYKYRCSCMTWTLSPDKHLRQRRGPDVCRSCRYTLAYVGEVRHNGTWHKDKLFTSGQEPKFVPSARRKGAPAGPATPAWKRPSPAPVLAPRTATPGSGTPSRPSVLLGSGAVSANAPTDAMLRYAMDLARRLKVSPTPAELASRNWVSAFIDRAKRALAAGSPGSGTKVGPAPPVPPPRVTLTGALMPAPLPPPSAPVREVRSIAEDEPTPRQLSYAQSIAQRKSLPLPSDVARSRRALSQWIDRHK